MLRGHTFFGDSSQGSSMTIQATKRLRISAYLSASFLLIFAGLAVFPVANSVSDTNAAKKDLQTTTLSMSSSDFYANPKVTSATGTFTSSSTEISVSTDNYTGYTIGIAAKTDDSDYSKLKSVDGELNSISSATTEEEFSAASGTSLNGLWGYKPSMLSSSANTDFLPAPTFEGDELNRTNSANVQADTYTISLGARADSSTPYGRYKNAFVIRTVANPIGIVFAYHENTEDTVTNMPVSISASLSDEKIEVSETVPERSGYELAGWCDGSTRTVLNVDYCDGEKYEGGDSYWLDRSGMTAEVNLYAMWKPTGTGDYICNSSATSISEAVCMQDMNASVKASMVAEQQYKLFDSRDSKAYYVSKLNDGHVWMTQNLDFELSSSTTLTHADTDLGWTEYDTNASWTPSKSTMYNISSWVDDYAGESPQSFKSEDKYYIPSGTTAIDKKFTSLDECSKAAGSREDCEHRKTGVFYNWPAATASDNTMNIDSFTVLPDSICPAGWRLPYGEHVGTDPDEVASDYARLMYTYGFIPDISATEMGGLQDSIFGQIGSAPLYLMRGGYTDSSGLRYEGLQGSYSTSTAGGYEGNVSIFSISSNGYDFNDARIYSASNWSRGNGFALRCVARDEITITFDANGGEGTMEPITLYGDTYLPANQFTKANKSFVGWNTEPDGSGTEYGMEYSSTKHFVLRGMSSTITLYAQWKDKTVISYDGNGADSGSVENQYVDYLNSTTISYNSFVRDGYGFHGWNTESDGSGVDYRPGDVFTAEEIEGATITLYAKWQAASQHTVNYIGDNITNVVKYSCSGSTYTATKYSHTQNIDDTGLKLSNYGESWTEANITGTDRGDTSKAHVVTIPGASSLNVQIYYNGESTNYDWVSVWKGKHPEYTAYNNYNSADVIWSKLGGSYNYNYTVNGNTLSRVGSSSTWIEGDSVTFGFRSDGGGYGNGYGYYAIITATVVDVTCDAMEGAYTEFPDTETRGYLGWSASNNSSYVAYYSEQEVLENIIYNRYLSNYTSTNVVAAYGNWTNITFDANDGSGSTSIQKIPYPKTVKLNKNTFMREGYDFYAWNDQPDGSGTYYSDEQDYPVTNFYGGNITLYAQWSQKAEYTVNYHNGENVNTVKYNCWNGRYTNRRIAHTDNIDDSGNKTGELNRYYDGSTVIKIPNATRLHVRLVYGTNSISNAFAVIWQGEKESGYSPYYYYGSGLKLGDNTTGKYGGNNNGENIVVEDNIAGDTISIGFYNDYNGSNYANGYGYYIEVTAEFGSMFCDDEPTYGQYVEPTGEENDVFTGWSLDSTAALGSYMNELEVKSALTDNSANVDMYAIWAKPTVLKFDNNGGNGEMNDIIVKYGDAVTMPNNTFTYGENVVFKYWNTAADESGTTYNASTTFNATDPLGGNKTLYAIWGMPYIVHFDANGGTGEMADLILTYNGYAYLPNGQFKREHCRFQGWNTKPDGTGRSYYVGSSFYPSNFDTHEITLYAIWGIGVTFEFDANGGAGEMEPFTIIYNSSAPLPPNEFTNEGYMFAYWNTEPDNSGTRYTNEQTYSANSTAGPDHITLYAIWGNPTTIIYDGNGADSGSMDNHVVNYGDTINLDSNQFVKNGSIFVGWNTSADGNGTSYVDEGDYTALDTLGGNHYLYAIWGNHKLDSNHNAENEDPNIDPDSPSAPSAGAVTLARAYEIYYSAHGMGMYVPHKDPQTGEYDGTYFEATEASDYEGIPAKDLRFAMQDMNQSICNSVTVYDERYDKVIDLRDFKSYFISKLRDGRCWMTQNLDLDIETTPDKVAALTSENTDINYYNPTSGSDYYHNGYTYDSTTGLITWNPSASTIDMAYQEDVAISGWGTDNKTTPASLNVGDTVFYSDRSNEMYVGHRLSYSSIDECVLAGNARSRCRHLQSGNYYNYAAVIANNQVNTPELHFDYNADPNTFHAPKPENSICPKGWTLPDTGDEIYQLVNIYEDYLYDGWGNGHRHLFRTPLFISRAGRILEGKLQHKRDLDSPGSSNDGEEIYLRGSRIFHTINDGSYIGTLGFGMTMYIADDGDNRASGYGGGSVFQAGEGESVRCMAR